MILVGSNNSCRSSGSDTPPCPNVTSTTPQPGPWPCPPLWNSKASPKWGQGRRNTEKILIPWDGSPWWGWHTCSHLCVTLSAVLRHSLCRTVRILSPLHNTKVACFQYWWCHSKKSGEIHHSPWGYSGVTSSPCTSFFSSETQPLQLHFCAALRQWLKGKPGGLFCSPAAQDLYAEVQMWVCKYNIHSYPP